MSVERFQVVLKPASLGNDEKVWFGRWLRRYAVFLHQPENLPLLVSQERVKQFCRTLLLREVPAWQRLQAVRAKAGVSVFSFQFSVLKFERQSLAFLTRNVAVFEPKRSALVWNILLFST